MGVFKIDDMTCSQCEKAIKSELKKGDNTIAVEVDVKKKLVKVENLPNDRVLFLLKEIGYSPELIK